MTKPQGEVKRVLTLPVSIIRLLEPFGAIFQVKIWQKAQLLLVGAILSPGKRTVTSALRVMGLSGDGNFASYHHVLNRASWSSLQLSRTLLFLLLCHLDPGVGPLVFGMDRAGKKVRGLTGDEIRRIAQVVAEGSTRSVARERLPSRDINTVNRAYGVIFRFWLSTYPNTPDAR